MKKKILMGVSILFGLMFINSGMNKIFKYIPIPPDLPEKMVKFNAAMMEMGWLVPLIAIVEIIGGILVMTNKFRALGAIMILPIMIGVLFTHITMSIAIPIAAVLMGINLWIIYENREKYLPMIR